MNTPQEQPKPSAQERFVNAMREDRLSSMRSTNEMRDPVNVNGRFRLIAKYADGTQEVLVEDPNLVVSLGRRAMSRLISGAAGAPDVIQSEQLAFRVIRGTSGGVTSAWISFEQVPGTNEYRLRGHTNATSPEFTIQFAPGTKTLATLATEITAAAGGNLWAADVLNGLGTRDATLLKFTPNAPCLGNVANYTSVPTASPLARRLFGLYNNVRTIPSNNPSSLYVSRMRFGTQGHIPAEPTKGKDVLSTDESLTSPLRAIDLGNTVDVNDFLPATASYLNASQVTFTATLGVAQANNLSLSEVGLYTAGDILVARKNFNQILKTDTYEAEAVWTLIF